MIPIMRVAASRKFFRTHYLPDPRQSLRLRAGRKSLKLSQMHLVDPWSWLDAQE